MVFTPHELSYPGVLYERKVDKDLGAALERLATSTLDEVQAAVVRDALRDYKRATALNKQLAQRKAELESRGYQGVRQLMTHHTCMPTGAHALAHIPPLPQQHGQQHVLRTIFPNLHQC